VSEREEDATTDISDSFLLFSLYNCHQQHVFILLLTHSPLFIFSLAMKNIEYCPHYYEKKASNIIQAQYCSHYNNTRRGAAVVVSLTLVAAYIPSFRFWLSTPKHTSKRFSILLIENKTSTLFFSSISIQF
jgi:hypothetical protein